MPVFNPPQFSDAQFRVWDNGDFTKKIALEASGITTATTRTLTPQNASYTIAGLETTQTFSGTNTVAEDKWRFSNSADATDLMRFDLAGSSPGATRILTVQNQGNHTIAGLELPQTFTAEQTIDTPGDALTIIHDPLGDHFLVVKEDATARVFNFLVDSFTAATKNITFPSPDVTDVSVCYTNSTQTLFSKTIGTTNTITAKDSTFSVVDDGDSTKTAKFSLGGATAGADLTLAWSGTADRTVTIPDSTTTLAGLATAQTFTAANTVNLLTAGAATGNDDVVGAQINAWASGGANNVFLKVNDTSSLSSSGFTYSLAFTSPTVDRTITFPNNTGQVVLTSSTDVLTNKTLGAPGGIRCSTSTGSGIKFQNSTSTTQIMMLDLSDLTTQRDIKFMNIAGTVALDTNHVVDSSGNILVDSSGNVILSI